ncbi:MAG: aspartate dehydrogenase [Flavonifractor sp.]|jgi:hypothetical protein|nr:aspartate dehydrogenase [Flavonifractor sp.]
MFLWKREPAVTFDKTGRIPVIRASICTGEQVAGFRDEATGKFTEMMLLRSEADLRTFMRTYGVAEEEIKREW